MAGDSHTNFNSGAFTAGAVTGSLALAGAFVGTLQALVQANREACARWTHNELKEAFNASELLRFKRTKELTDLRAEHAELQAANEQLRLLVRSFTVRPAGPSR
jgi:hypothetical protein